MNQVNRIIFIMLAIACNYTTAASSEDVSTITLAELQQRQKDLMTRRGVEIQRAQTDAYNELSNIRKAAIKILPIATLCVLGGASIYLDCKNTNRRTVDYPLSFAGIPCALLGGAGVHIVLMPDIKSTPETDSMDSALRSLQEELYRRSVFFQEEQQEILDRAYLSRNGPSQ